MYVYILSIGSYLACKKSSQIENLSEIPDRSSTSHNMAEDTLVVSTDNSLISIQGMENVVLQSLDGNSYFPEEVPEGTYQLYWKRSDTEKQYLIDVTLQKDKTVHVVCDKSFWECKISNISETSPKIDQQEATSHFTIQGLDSGEYYFIDPTSQITYTQSPMPKGTYKLYVKFAQEYTFVSSYSIEENQSITIVCNEAFMTCR